MFQADTRIIIAKNIIREIKIDRLVMHF